MNESFLKRNYRILKTKGFTELFYKFFCLLFPVRIKHYQKISEHFRYKDGIEIGGPSPIFSSKGRMPLYHLTNSLDGCNFSRNTLWEGDIETDDYHYATGKSGYQFIADAVALDINITKKTYDCLISSNCLEHIANPMKAIENWLGLLNLGGIILIIVPNKNVNFDHNRDFTAYDHILKDYKDNIKEEDLFHLDEVLDKHDFSQDTGVANFDEFKTRSLDNINNRAIHHHVFNEENLTKMFSYFNVDIIEATDIRTDYLIIGRKS